jgi:hypothetical protein
MLTLTRRNLARSKQLGFSWGLRDVCDPTAPDFLAWQDGDGWVFDETCVVLCRYDGDGNPAGGSLPDHCNARRAKLCSDALDAAWQRAVPHAEYRVR